MGAEQVEWMGAECGDGELEVPEVAVDVVSRWLEPVGNQEKGR